MGISDLKTKQSQETEQAAPVKPHQKIIGLHKLIPNLMTLTALAAGLTSIQYAWDQNWERAVYAILIAVILDALDGATARLLKATSEFGAQLDSLSDFLAFGVAPAIILYSWILEETGKVGWIAMIVFAAACALRLARFNVTQKELPAWKKGFFSGVPAPAGAGLGLLPLILWIQDPRFFEQFAIASPLVALWMFFVAALMVSRIPTFSTKMIHLPAKFAMPAMALAALVIAALVHAPWQTLTIAALAYLAAIPFAISKFRKLQKENGDGEDITDLALGAIVIDDLQSDKED
ncbi:MAG: CDP-diacylglycerol--serine O-phosphatidyltransferase [Micavibrio aeruginosavorus]|uniref:CDP-diacylglycerol--serine O-phosphatidyltransferase n=1 Tax=Micavibrio aeruginosavorus TaxID=349221 RepID=A0A2W5A2P0_9BACT|nr:MAG: CDP-diacylglycerol--serine O-phosphatidyltransferase [Micavibrio aeruginosavorus]